MTSQGIPEDLKQQLAKKEAEKEQKGREIKELVEERKKLETKLLETTDKEQAARLEAAIKSVKEDVDRISSQLPALNEQIKFLLGECDFFFFFFFLARLRNSIHLFRLSFLPSLPHQVRAKQFAYGHSNLQYQQQQPQREFSAYPEAGI